MGLLNDLMGKEKDLLGKEFESLKGQYGQEGGLVAGILSLLNNKKTGGFEGLIQSFKEKGLGDIISSWVGTGANAAITPEQVEKVLGSNVVQQLAAKSGIPLDAAKNKLSELLPKIIDKATPEGKIPEGSLLGKGEEIMQKLFAQK